MARAHKGRAKRNRAKCICNPHKAQHGNSKDAERIQFRRQVERGDRDGGT